MGCPCNLKCCAMWYAPMSVVGAVTLIYLGFLGVTSSPLIEIGKEQKKQVGISCFASAGVYGIVFVLSGIYLYFDPKPKPKTLDDLLQKNNLLVNDKGASELVGKAELVAKAEAVKEISDAYYGVNSSTRAQSQKQTSSKSSEDSKSSLASKSSVASKPSLGSKSSFSQHSVQMSSETPA